MSDRSCKCWSDSWIRAVVSSRIIYNDRELRSLLTSPTGPVVRDIMRRGQNVENRAKRLCPVDSGRLRASITHELRRERDLPVVRIGTNVKYAGFVHEGTGLFGPFKRLIRPKTKSVLRFEVRGRRGRRTVVYAPAVKGMPPRPFLEESLKAAAA